MRDDPYSPDAGPRGGEGGAPVVLAVATATPPHRLPQAETRAFARRFFARDGGTRVLAAYEEVFGVDQDKLSLAREVLRDHGNMSSPTLLFVLERFMASTPPSGAAGLLLGLGPGFAAEGVVFRW